MSTLYRGTFTQLWIVLTSDEPLGVLDTDYLEDFYGTDGQITLFHAASGQRFEVPMLANPPGSKENFRGQIPLAALPNGQFQVECRVRDLVGNYTIVGQVQNPIGTEMQLMLNLRILPGQETYPASRTGALYIEGALVGALAFDEHQGELDWGPVNAGLLMVPEPCPGQILYPQMQLSGLVAIE